jgi:hypothetical protein
MQNLCTTICEHCGATITLVPTRNGGRDPADCDWMTAGNSWACLAGRPHQPLATHWDEPEL